MRNLHIKTQCLHGFPSSSSSLFVGASGATKTGSPLLLVLAPIGPASVCSINVGIGAPPWSSRTGPLALFVTLLPSPALFRPAASWKSLAPPLLSSVSTSLLACSDGDLPLSVCLNAAVVPTIFFKMDFGWTFPFLKAGPLAVPTGFLPSLTVN